jgi:hypothetical protein
MDLVLSIGCPEHDAAGGEPCRATRKPSAEAGSPAPPGFRTGLR